VIWSLLKGTARKFYADNGLFLASGLAFDLLLSCFPLSLLLVSALGYTIVGSEQALAEVDTIVQRLLPRSGQAFTESLSKVVESRGILGFLGFALFFLLGSVTFASARIVLNTVFEVRHPRSFLKGKAIDFVLMLAAGALFLLGIATFWFLSLLQKLGEGIPLLSYLMRPGWVLVSSVLGFLLTVALFYVMYRFSPPRSLRPVSLYLASFLSAALFELSKWTFSWYLDFVHDMTPLYGAMGGFFFFFLWLYYASLVFVIGAEVGWVFEQSQERLKI
jgi:membrane protein